MTTIVPAPHHPAAEPHRVWYRKICDACGAPSLPMLIEVLETRLAREGWSLARPGGGPDRDLCPACARADTASPA